MEFEGRYAAMLSHEPKNYALLRYDGSLILRGAAFRSSRAEPFGEAFLREALAHLLAAMLASGRTSWRAGDRVRVYRKRNGGYGLLGEPEDGQAGTGTVNDRDYDVDHCARQLRQTFASRLACAFTAADYETVFADPEQMSLFMPAIGTIRTILEKKRALTGAG